MFLRVETIVVYYDKKEIKEEKKRKKEKATNTKYMILKNFKMQIYI